MRTNRFTAILRVLGEGPATPRQIAARLGIPYKCLYGSVRYLDLMLEEGQVHIVAWARQHGHGGPPIPVYAAGEGDSVPRPTPKRKLTKAGPPKRSGVAALLFDLIGKKG